MMRVFVIILFTLYGIPRLFSQESKPIYFESMEDGLVRFYYDANYYLVDKNCEFVSIEREGQFDSKTSKFVGSFVDYTLDGRMLLEGSYQGGLKHGLFRAYHSNKAIKWEVNFIDGKPIGDWRYYYPDGLLMMVLQFSDSTTRLQEFWDTHRRQTIKDGNGKYDFKVPYQGYNPYGYPFVQLKGAIKNGVPNGYWQVYFEAEGKRVFFADEYYRNGVFLKGYNTFDDEDYEKPKFNIGPIDNFWRGEALLSKSCNFDEFSGYPGYLMTTLNEYLKEFDLPDFGQKIIEYTVKVDKNGIPEDAKLLTPSEVSGFDRSFIQVVRTIDNYIPSFKDGVYLDDELTVSGIVEPSNEGGLFIHQIKISRKIEGQKD